MTSSAIHHIPLANLYHNPNNPRRKIGDISELADSIASMGILQNMTVVPYDPSIHCGLTVADPANAYIILIGNRRFEGGKKAKVATAPCVIMEGLNAAEQMGIMLVENNQREDLTYTEQAYGFQYMLDMGESVESVAQKTGFSSATVRNRIQLCDLDREKVDKAAQRGATLSDYMKLFKIQDPELRNSVLDTIGTPNFNYSLKDAKDKEANRIEWKNRINILDSFASKIDAVQDGMKTVASYYNWEKSKAVEIPADADTVDYYYSESSHCLYVYRYKLDNEITEETAKQERYNQFKNQSEQLKAIHKRMRSLREDFIMNLSAAAAKRSFADIAGFAYPLIANALRTSYYDSEYKIKIAKFLEVVADDAGNIDDEKLREAFSRVPEYSTLVLSYVVAEHKCGNYYTDRYVPAMEAYPPIYKADDNLDELYFFLEKLGYVMSDEEKNLQNGTHPLFYQEPAANAS